MNRLSPTFQTLVVQPTTLCNLNCSYCYISELGRKSRREMSLPVARALAASVEAQNSDMVVDVVWHGGEPLTTRRGHFHDLVDVFEPLRQKGYIRHYVQTNATLIDSGWCDFFSEYGFRVGISVDGPAIANTDRVDWSGRAAFPRVIRGIQVLKERGIEFSAICVVTAETITDPDPLLDFFETLGAASVGFNIEESEGANNNREVVAAGAVRRFWGAMFDRVAGGSSLNTREAGRLLGYLADVKAGRKRRWTSMPHDPIPTVGWNGDTVLLSPELLGVKDDRYGDFVIGNIIDESLASMIGRAHKAIYVREFFQGVEECQASCAFFDFCQGGQAGNRYFETGGFGGTETNYCRNAKQELVIALNESLGV